jgi:hypothetical protein
MPTALTGTTEKTDNCYSMEWKKRPGRIRYSLHCNSNEMQLKFQVVSHNQLVISVVHGSFLCFNQ